MSEKYTTCYATHNQPRQCQAGNYDKCSQLIQQAKCPRRTNVGGEKHDDERDDDETTTTLTKNHATCLLGIKDNRRNNLATNPIRELSENHQTENTPNKTYINMINNHIQA